MHSIRSLSIALPLALVLAAYADAAPVGTAFTYQGRLEDGGAPANGIYDLEFALYDAATSGTQIGSTVTKDDVAVANGLFVVALDFGSAAFAGEARWLQIGVRPGASSDPFTQLASRQELTPTPNAIQVPWAGVSAKPAGFADDVDNDSGGDITAVTAGSGLAGGGTTGDVTLSLDTSTTDGLYVQKAGDTMAGTLTLNPAVGVGLSTSADINILGRVMRGTAPFIHANTSLLNTAIGESALQADTTGYFNTAAGWSALYSNTAGYNNTATGRSALYHNTTGSGNTGTGAFALDSNTTGFYNTATGVDALSSNNEGWYNTAIGADTLLYNTSGVYNTAMGVMALKGNTSGSDNTAAGVHSLENNTTGRDNTAMGVVALRNNTTGDYNTAIGSTALVANTSGGGNMAIGFLALGSNTTGADNAAAGSGALQSNTTGRFNTATGATALYSNTTGNDNTATGHRALWSSATGDGNTAVGENALYSNTAGSGNIALGYQAGYNATTGNYNIYVGNQGVADEDNTIRVGDGNQTRFFVAGVSGVPVSSAALVGITSAGQLGTVPMASPAVGQMLKWSGTEWAASEDADSGGDITSVAAGSGLTGGGTAGDVALSLDTATTDSRYTLKSGDTMTGTLNLPLDGLSVTSDQLVLSGGNVGIGTPAPAQKLTVAGTIASTSGGFQFPDSTTQPTANVAVYTRWGKSSCPLNRELLYSGYAASGSYALTGGGRNMLCLTDSPTWSGGSPGNEDGNLIFGVEFETAGYGVASLAPLQDRDARCAVCLRSGASLALMIPGGGTCPSGFWEEYRGYVMSTRYDQQGGEMVCVDETADAAGSAASEDGHLWYPTEIQCGSLPCGIYLQDMELTCVVCSR